MHGTTIQDRKNELRVLLDQMKANPTRDFTEERKRVVVLQDMIRADERAKADAAG